MNVLYTKSSLSISTLRAFFCVCCLFTLSAADLVNASTHQASWQKNQTPLNIQLFHYQKSLDDNKSLPLLDQHWQTEKKLISYLSSQHNNSISWLKLSIENTNAYEIEQFIEVAAKVRSIDLYRIEKNSGQISVELELPHNFKQAFNERPINYRHLVYPLTINANEKNEYLLKVQHDFSQRIQIRAWSDQGLQSAKSQELIFFGMIYGAFFMIVIYNFFIFISTRERSHLFFVLFGTFSGIFLSMHEGHFAQFIASNSEWTQNTFFAMVSAIMCFCFSFFTITFLDLEARSKFFYRLMLSSGSIAAITLIILGINEHYIIFSHYTLLIIIATFLPAIAAGFFSRYNGVNTAGFFSLAIFLCALGLSFDVLSSIEFITWSRWSFSYASIGYTAMIIVFAVSLADKMRALNAEKLAATIELVKLTEEKAQSNIEVYKSRLNEVQLEQQADEAKIESRAKSDFLATMSHEIRTPMNGILGITELLKDTALDAKQDHFVSSISKSAKSLLNVINDLLDYSKIESGKIELEAKVFNIESIIDDCISISALKAAEKKINFIGQISPDTHLQLKGDAPKIRQITLNLINNAFNHAQGKDVFLSVFETDKKSVNSLEIKVLIECRDTLLSEQEQHLILHPFHQTSAKNKLKGQELGLSVSSQLIDMMHGKLGISCDEDKKLTQFWFTARLLEPHDSEKQNLTDRSKNLIGRRLIICDSNQAFMNSIKSMTESWGMHCCTVNNTREVADTLISDKKAYQVLIISEDMLTPEVQLAVRKSNVDHNFNTSVMVTCRSRFSVSKDEMKKRGIQSILETPYTTVQLYNTLLRSMGIDNQKPTDEEFNESLSVMIAEDNSVNQMVIEGLLKKLHIKPVVAANGLEAVQFWEDRKEGFDLILMDCEMPEMDGYEATEKIRENALKRGLQTIIVGLSAHSSQEHKEKAFISGMNDFIVKPLATGEIDELLEHIQQGKFQQEMTYDD